MYASVFADMHVLCHTINLHVCMCVPVCKHMFLLVYTGVHRGQCDTRM